MPTSLKPRQHISSEETIRIGRFGRPFGVKGWLHIRPLTAMAADICHYRPWIIIQSDTPKELAVHSCRAHGKGFIAKIETITDRDQAAELTGQSIYLPAGKLPKLPSDEYYLRDLLGVVVVTSTGAELGTVCGLIETGGAHDVLQIKDSGGKEHLIPWLMAEGIIQAVDLDAGRITVNWDPDD